MTPTYIQAIPWDRVRMLNEVRLAVKADAEVVWDSEHSGYLTYLKVLREMGRGPAILLEDDVILTSDWRAKIEAVIAEYPNDVIRFFAAEDLGLAWLSGKDYCWNQCVYFPAGVPEDFLSYLATVKPDEKYHDLLFGRYLTKRKRLFLSYSPSLVQHMRLQSSVLPRRNRNRVSPTFRRD